MAARRADLQYREDILQVTAIRLTARPDSGLFPPPGRGGNVLGFGVVPALSTPRPGSETTCKAMRAGPGRTVSIPAFGVAWWRRQLESRREALPCSNPQGIHIDSTEYISAPAAQSRPQDRPTRKTAVWCSPDL